MPLVTILTLNYNSSDYTIKCIQSIRDKTNSSVSYEIIVVDNNSENDEWKKLRVLKENPQVKVVPSKMNLGFAGGLMYGLQFANDSEYVLFLNNDAVFENDCLDALVTFMQQTPGAGLCTGQMLNSKGGYQHSFTHYQTLAKTIFGIGLLRFFNKAKYPYRKKVYEQPIQVDTIAGSFMFARMSAVEKIGGLDTRYFLYCEEEDFSRRMDNEGYSVYLVPAARFIHHESKSTVKSYAIMREYYISLNQYQQKFYALPVRLLLRLLLGLKVLKRFYRDIRHLRLGWFILCGSNPAKSLRYKQEFNSNSRM